MLFSVPSHTSSYSCLSCIYVNMQSSDMFFIAILHKKMLRHMSITLKLFVVNRATVLQEINHSVVKTQTDVKRLKDLGRSLSKVRISASFSKENQRL